MWSKGGGGFDGARKTHRCIPCRRRRHPSTLCRPFLHVQVRAREGEYTGDGRLLFVVTTFNRGRPTSEFGGRDRFDLILVMMDEMREACEVKQARIRPRQAQYPSGTTYNSFTSNFFLSPRSKQRLVVGWMASKPLSATEETVPLEKTSILSAHVSAKQETAGCRGFFDAILFIFF